MRTHLAAPAAVVLMLSLAGAPAAIASGPQAGGIPIPTPGFMIDRPGSYFLAADLDMAPGQVGITVNITQPFDEERGIDIDLNGHTILAGANGGAIVSPQGYPVTIRNGTLSGGDTAVLLDSTSRVVLSDLHIESTALFGVRLIDVRQFDIRNVHVDNLVGGGDGISVFTNAPGTLTSGTIESCQVLNAAIGIDVTNGSAVAVTDNRVDQTSNIGIRITTANGLTLANNIVSNAQNTGILVSGVNGSSVRHNVVQNANLIGLWLFAVNDSVILRNSISAAGADGMNLWASSGNHIEHNLMSGCTGYGLRFNTGAGSNVYRANAAQMNNGAACIGVSTSDFCDEDFTNRSSGDNYMPAQM